MGFAIVEERQPSFLLTAHYCLRRLRECDTIRWRAHSCSKQQCFDAGPTELPRRPDSRTAIAALAGVARCPMSSRAVAAREAADHLAVIVSARRAAASRQHA
jgi:hypothetical protein